MTTEEPKAVMLPTHQCFDDALDFIEHRLKEKPADVHRFVLVHAICLAPDGPTEGQPFAHGWVEEHEAGTPPLAWQGGIYNGEKVFYACDAHELETTLRAQDVSRYSMQEASDHNHRTMSYGPWEERYKALCKSPHDAPKPEDK